MENHHDDGARVKAQHLIDIAKWGLDYLERNEAGEAALAVRL